VEASGHTKYAWTRWPGVLLREQLASSLEEIDEEMSSSEVVVINESRPELETKWDSF
jgi:hypothetical protein